MKNFVKPLSKNGDAFQHLSAKLKEGIFVETRIWEVLKDTDFEELFKLKEMKAWDGFSL